MNAGGSFGGRFLMPTGHPIFEVAGSRFSNR